jgi:hypothetical protein
MSDMDVAFKFIFLFGVQGSLVGFRGQLVDAVQVGLRKADVEQVTGLVGSDVLRIRDEHSFPDGEFRISNRLGCTHAAILLCVQFLSMVLRSPPKQSKNTILLSPKHIQRCGQSAHAFSFSGRCPLEPPSCDML